MARNALFISSLTSPAKSSGNSAVASKNGLSPILNLLSFINNNDFSTFSLTSLPILFGSKSVAVKNSTTPLAPRLSCNIFIASNKRSLTSLLKSSGSKSDAVTCFAISTPPVSNTFNASSKAFCTSPPRDDQSLFLKNAKVASSPKSVNISFTAPLLKLEDISSVMDIPVAQPILKAVIPALTANVKKCLNNIGTLLSVAVNKF